MRKGQSNFWRGFPLVFGAWTLFALFMLLQSYAYRTRVGQEINLPVLLAAEFSYAYLWLALTPVVLWFGRKFRIEKSNILPSMAIHIAASVLISGVHKIASGVIFELVKSTQATPFSWETQLQGVLAYVDYGILIYWIILLLEYSLDYYRRYRDSEIAASQLETQLARAHLETLRMQIQPHFLFNTLNAISVLVDKDPDGARKTLGRLSDLLRLTLEYGSVQEVPLEREMDFLERYLAIERTRFGDRLTVRLDVEPEVMHASVPAMILQPLVENAIKHGINKQRGPGLVEISAVRGNGTLRMTVRDNGSGISAGTDRKGVGLVNTRERLQRLYGEEFLLEVKNNEGAGVTATIAIPFRTTQDEA